VVVVKIALGNRGIVAVEISHEQYAQCHGSKSLVKVNWGPVGCPQNVSDQVNDIPYCIMVVALIGVQPQHGMDEIGLYKITAKKHHSVVIGMALRNASWEHGCWKLGLTKVSK